MFYDKWDKSDPRREFNEMVYMVKPPSTEDAGNDKYNFNVTSYFEPHKELYDKGEAEGELNPEPELEPEPRAI